MHELTLRDFIDSTVQRLRQRSRRRLSAWQDDVIGLSHSLHAEPELAYEEHRSARKIAELMERAGFAVQRGVCDLPTAFIATAGTGELVVGICAEYDALPEIGHACGHNVNAAAAVAAALSLAEVANEVGVTVKLLGTPAEEAGGGKIDMLQCGAFDDVAAAMMVHASPTDALGLRSLAVRSWRVTYTGRSAHATSMPHAGINAADAMLIAQVAINAYRQQMPPGCAVSGIVTSGGEAANIIPSHTSGVFDCRAETTDSLRELRSRIRACFEAGALATGAELVLEVIGNDYADLRQDDALKQLYQDAAAALGRSMPHRDSTLRGASTDMGNISHVIPVIHPMIGYDCADAVMHNPEFTRYGITPQADRAVLDGGLALAWTAIGMATDSSHRRRLLGRLMQRGSTSTQFSGSCGVSTVPHPEPTGSSNPTTDQTVQQGR